jgi:hypothetical protein
MPASSNGSIAMEEIAIGLSSSGSQRVRRGWAKNIQPGSISQSQRSHASHFSKPNNSIRQPVPSRLQNGPMAKAHAGSFIKIAESVSSSPQDALRFLKDQETHEAGNIGALHLTIYASHDNKTSID